MREALLISERVNRKKTLKAKAFQEHGRLFLFLQTVKKNNLNNSIKEEIVGFSEKLKKMKILKFGGTSVGSVAAIKELISIVKENHLKNERMIVVCSAMSGITNSLLQMATDAQNKIDFKPALHQLENLHYVTLRELLPVKSHNPLILKIKVLINEIEEILHGIDSLAELSFSVQDRISAFGEQLSCLIITGLIQEELGKAVYVDARSIIKTDNSFGNANVNFELSNRLINKWYAEINDYIPVVTGFIASNEKGQTTTLGRGGSDYTASILGSALNAGRIEIWTDVDGFMTADPRMVKKAYVLEELSYHEAMELSYFGAKVIYPPTIIPAVEKGIPIVIRNTLNRKADGTLIHQTVSDNSCLLKGISSVRDVCLINLEGGGMIGRRGTSARFLAALASEKINIILITQACSEHCISLAISQNEAERALQIAGKEFEFEIQNKQIAVPYILPECSIIAVVGENMRNTSGISGKLFNALGKGGVNVIAIAQGSSEMNISVVIEKKDLKKALNAVHDDLFLSPAKTLNVFMAGTGNIGSELLAQIHKSENHLSRSNGVQLQLQGICNSSKMLFAEKNELSFESAVKKLSAHGNDMDLCAFVRRIKELNLPHSVFIDNTSSDEVVSHYEKLFHSKVAVVTCNKLANSAPLADYRRIKMAGQKSGAAFYYETNVGAGLPIIRTLNDLMISGDKILKVEAILSGTISYLFNNYDGSRSFADIVKEANANGYTEPDPRVDLSGLDFAKKLLILGREMGLAIELKDVQREPLLPESCLEAKDLKDFFAELEKAESFFADLIQRAKSKNCVLRYIGTISEGNLKLALQEVRSTHPFFHLEGNENIISFTSMRYHRYPLVVKGPGAGASVTAAGVFADLMRVANY